jgi:hypothetical protein
MATDDTTPEGSATDDTTGDTTPTEDTTPTDDTVFVEPPPEPTIPRDTTATTLDPETGEPGQNDAPSDAVIPDCETARELGMAPLYAGDLGYTLALDPDGDGVACDT